MASRQAGPYGGAQRLDSAPPVALREHGVVRRASPSASARISDSETNGMSQATHTTGAGASTTAV